MTLAQLAALSLVAGGRSFDWASATTELELLKGLTPAANDAPKAPFVKLGGSCWQPGPAEESCENLCSGPGLTWADFEALSAVVNRTPVVDVEVSPVAQMFRSRAACEAATADLDATFKPAEPPFPPKR